MNNKNSKFYLFLIVVLYVGFTVWAYYSDSKYPSNNLLDGTSGNLIISALGGIVFFVIGLYFQRENDLKIEELHQKLSRENNIESYERMITFLKSEQSYDFFVPEPVMSTGNWFTYSMRGKKEGTDAVGFETDLYKEYVIGVEDIPYRSVMDEEELAEYIYGPLKVGNSYFLRFRDGKWFVESNNKLIEICRFGKVGGVYNKPTANQLFYSNKFETKIVTSFLYNSEGEEARSGTSCEIHISTDNNVYLRLAHEGELKKVIMTYPKDDYTKEHPFIKIEKVEGFFSSKNALDNFKNIVNCKLQENSISLMEIEFFNDRVSGQ